MAKLAGGCRCGALRYEVTGEPHFTIACHCKDCQKLSSSAFSLGFVVEEAQFEIVRGEAHEWVKEGSSGKPSSSFTCPICAVWTHTKPQAEAGFVIVRPTTLDDPSWFRPLVELYTRSALPWARMPTLFAFEEQFDDTAPLAAAFKASGMAPGSRPST